MLTRTVPPRPRAIFLGGEGVHYEERAPGPELAPWVAAFWRLRCDRPYSLRVLPDGCMDIIGGDVVGSLTSALVANSRSGRRGDGGPPPARGVHGALRRAGKRAVRSSPPARRRRTAAAAPRARARRTTTRPARRSGAARVRRAVTRAGDGLQHPAPPSAAGGGDGPQSQAPGADRSHAGNARGGAWRELGAHRDRVRLPRRVAHDQRHPRSRQRHSAGSAQRRVWSASRGGRIRTGDFSLPKRARYQAAPRPDRSSVEPYRAGSVAGRWRTWRISRASPGASGGPPSATRW